MGVATGCGCKEVYRFPHTTYPYSSCICSFAAASLLFVHETRDEVQGETRDEVQGETRDKYKVRPEMCIYFH